MLWCYREPQIQDLFWMVDAPRNLVSGFHLIVARLTNRLFDMHLHASNAEQVCTVNSDQCPIRLRSVFVAGTS
jgi:hypothetical protein